MIENPDGTRRVPTKEEILYGIRNGTRGIPTIAGGSQATNGTNKSAYSEGRLVSEPAQPRPYTISRRDAIDESYETSSDGTDVGLPTEVRPFRKWDSGDDEHKQRTTTFSTEYRPLKKPSIFKPYADAVKDSLRKNKPETKKRAAGKTLTKEEIDTNRLKLIETILWLSEQSDEVLKATTKGHATVIIWSDLDRKDAGLIADFLIERGKVNVQAANAVRGLINLRTRIQLGLIIAPRAYETMILYLERGFSIR